MGIINRMYEFSRYEVNADFMCTISISLLFSGKEYVMACFLFFSVCMTLYIFYMLNLCIA
jgi:hypothetical protein